jgi:hypothetical protein
VPFFQKLKPTVTFLLPSASGIRETAPVFPKYEPVVDTIFDAANTPIG